jgi:hypothetical protein
MEIRKNIIIAGWYEACVRYHDGNSGVHPHLINDEKQVSISIPSEYLEVFGYKAHGPMLGIMGGEELGSVEEQINAVISIISLELKRIDNQPSWIDVREFLYTYQGKIRCDKIIPLSKIEKESIIRTVKIINDEYNTIYRNKIEFSKQYLSK